MSIVTTVLWAIAVGAIILVSHWLGQQAYGWLPTPAISAAEPIGDLFSFLVTLGSLVFLGVLSVLFYSVLMHRVDRHNLNDGPPIRGNLNLEIVWTVIPILLVTWIAIYSYQIYNRMNILGPLPMVHNHLLEDPAYAEMDSPPAQPDEVIEVTAKQWAWSFYYPNQKVTSSVLHLPVNRQMHLMLSSKDVLHGFYVPNFRIKQDIVPNRVIELKLTPTKIGQYQLHDSQFSGKDFALMQATVLIDTPEAYDQWLTQEAHHS